MGPAQQELHEALNALHLEVDQSIVKDIRARADAALAEAHAEGETITLAEFSPQPGVTILVTMPHNTPPESFRVAAEALKSQFPDHPILLKPEDWDIDVSPDGS